jgi:hypothetical protein
MKWHLVLNPTKLLTEVLRNDTACCSAACCSVCIRQEQRGYVRMHIASGRLHGSCEGGKMLCSEEIHTLGLLFVPV